MSEDHKTIDLEYDRSLLEDVFDSPELRYVCLYMFIIRKDVFKDLEDDDLIDQFDTLLNYDELTVGDIKRLCTGDFIKTLIKYHIITNVKTNDAFSIKNDDYKIRLARGVKLAHENLTDLEEEVHIFCKEEFLERVIAGDIPEMTRVQIHKALERLRAMMCPRSTVIHSLIHKYDDYYVLDDDFYYIIEELGNPYQALRIELMIRNMSGKYIEIATNLDEVLSQFDKELPKATYMNKFKKAKEKKSSDYLEYLVKKSRKIPIKFRVKFPDDKIPDRYLEFKKIFNTLIDLKLQFQEIDEKMDKLRAYYSGKNQIMPYMSFIEKTTYNEDNIADNVKKLLLTARNNLKNVSTALLDYPKKDIKLLNLDIERMIIEDGLDDEEEDE